jgi:hypothetical protein
MGWSQNHDLGAYVGEVSAAAVCAQTAGATAPVTGVIIDLQAVGPPLSAVVMIVFEAVLAVGKTLKFTYSLATSAAANMSSPTVLKSQDGTLAGTAASGTGGAGGSTVDGILTVPVNLSAAQRYLQFGFTPVLSATGTDTVTAASLLILGGAGTIT